MSLNTTAKPDTRRSAASTCLAAILIVGLISTQTSASESTSASEPTIDEQGLSWSIRQLPLRDVLQSLSQPLAFELTMSPKLPVQLISGEYSSVPIDTALSSILASQNYIIGRSPENEINHIYVFAEGETPTVAPRRETAIIKPAAKTEKQKLVDDLEALLPPGTLTQTMKDALLTGSTPPTEAEIADIRARQNEIFEEFKARFDALNQTESGSKIN